MPTESSVQSLRAKNHSRQGIALVIVLGFLSLLIVLAVAFAISMRTERLTALAYLNKVTAENAKEAALARLMSDMDRQLKFTTTRSLFPNAGVWVSTNGSTSDGLDLFPSAFNSPSGFTNSLNHLPLDIWYLALAEEGKARWQGITNSAVSVNEIARYAYLVVDVSGLIDISVAGELTHSNGITGRELSLEYLPEVQSSDLLPNRTKFWKRFETIPELWQLARGGNGLFSYPSNIFVYSRFMADKFIAATTNVDPLFIGYDEAAFSSNSFQADVVSRLTNSGLTQADAQRVYWNLYEYVDVDSVPNRGPDPLRSINTESVPMINEIVLSAELSRPQTNYVLDVYVDVETWHPFPSNSPSVQFDESNLPFELTVAGNPASANAVVLNPPLSPLIAMPGTFSQTAYSFRTNRFHFRGTGPLASDPTSIGVQLRFNAGKNLDMRLGPDVVDRVFPTFDSYPQALIQPATLPENSGANKLVSQPRNCSVSVIDPRFNYDKKYWDRSSTPTMGKTNHNVAGMSGVLPVEPAGELYVRNGKLKSVAELGFLAIGDAGRAWHTISLYDPDGAGSEVMHTVLDHFTIRTNKIFSGKVHLDTPNDLAWKSVFLGADIESAPGYKIDDFNWNDTAALRDRFLFKATSPITNISSVGWIGDSLLVQNNLSTDARRESVIRNSYEMFGLRQNLFVVYLITQSRGSLIPAEDKSIYYLWRDPVPNADGQHAWRVRFTAQLDSE
jgi:hypothetical protein